MRSSFEMTRLIFLCCPAETLQISRLFGVPACVSTFQPNKTSHNQWNEYIFGRRKKSLLLDMMIWVWYYLKPKHSVIFLVFQWDKGISKKNSKKLVRGAIRLPITFLRLNTMLKGKKQWMHWFGEPKHSVNYLVFQRDKGISRKSYKKLVRGAIRLPITFLWLNTMLKGKKQRKVALNKKLAISNFRCPGETHITNFTRLPL